MNKRRKVLSTVTAAALGLAGLIGAAAPAHAATATPATLYLPQASFICGDNGSSPQTLWTGAGGTGTAYNSSSAAVNAGNGDTLTIFNECSVTVYFSGGVSNTGQWVSIASGGSAVVTILDDQSSMLIWDGTSGLANQVGDFNVTGGGSGPSPGPTPTNGSSSAAPQTFELSITPTDGTSCRNTSESGTQGTWIDLPASSDCTPPATQANANLLGWATTPNFPVAIAQRQVSNGWGAYEIFNDEGQLTAVFIPAGGATFLSGSGQLYPIWSE